MTPPSINNLFLVEHDYQAEDLLNRDMKDKGEWVALGPSAMHYLSQKGIHYTIPEDYCSREEVEEVCISQFERLSTICRELDDILLKQDPFLREWGIRPFFFYLWQLGQLVDGLVSRTLQLEKILKGFSDPNVFVHLSSPKSWGGFGIGFSQEETLWGRLLTLTDWNICLHALPQIGTNIKRNRLKKVTLFSNLVSNIKRRLSQFTEMNLLLRSMVQSFRIGCKSNVWNILRDHNSKKGGVAFVMLNWVYEWACILPHLADDGHSVYFLSGEDLQRSCQSDVFLKYDLDFVDDLWNIFKGALYQAPINYPEIIRERFVYIVEYSSVIARSILSYLEKLSKNISIGILLTAVGVGFPSYVFKQFCRKKNIKVLSWQHGAEWYDKRITQRNDLLNLVSCDKMLVYGDGVKFAYEASPLAEEENCGVVSVGMPSLQRLRDIYTHSDTKKIRILWPFGGYYGNGWYCGFSPPNNDRIYYKEQMVILHNLLRLIEKYEHLSITVKLYPDTYLDENPPWVEDLPKSERIRIVYGRPNFVELLNHHEAVIIDSPTTTLLQAITTRLPVFVLMSVICWPGEATKLLQKRGCCAKNAEDLMVSLEEYIENNAYNHDVENNDFLKKYGIHNGDAVDSALFIVKRILDEKERPPTLNKKYQTIK
jgi:hypothetical protein